LNTSIRLRYTLTPCLSNRGKIKEITKLKVENISDPVLDFEYSDHVEVTTYNKGVLLSFGKFNPRAEKIIVTKQILLPYDVASSMRDIITEHINNIVDSNRLPSEYKKILTDGKINAKVKSKKE